MDRRPTKGSRRLRLSYRLLLRLYPKRFRELYGKDLIAQYEDSHRFDKHVGPISWLVKHWDITKNGLAIRLDAIREIFGSRRSRLVENARLSAYRTSLTTPRHHQAGDTMIFLPLSFRSVLGNLRNDFLFAVRMLLKNPMFTAAAV